MARSLRSEAALGAAIGVALEAQRKSGKPLAIVMAGHNGSGKSTFWRRDLAPRLQMPLVNADRMMRSILPEDEPLPAWAAALRDENVTWLQIAQKGVEAFVGQAMLRAAPFAMETVFSHWRELDDGTVESKVDLIREMQAQGYFVLLIFVGLMNVDLSVLRVHTRVTEGGHAVPEKTLRQRFPRTQRAICRALDVADAVVLTDNSRTEKLAFTVCHVRVAARQVFDLRDATTPAPAEVLAWLDVVAPRH